MSEATDPPRDDATEGERLEAVAADSWYASGINGFMARYTGDVALRFATGTRCLEVGPAEGLLAERLATVYGDLTLVEGSERFCEILRTRFPRATVVRALVEDYNAEHPFDLIVLGHVLEHVLEPASVLRRCRDWLTDTGRIFAAVPNARSVHRQAAVQMGMLESVHSMSEADVHHGHRRVYDPESLRADVRSAGLSLVHFGGYWLKPLSNAQIEATWTDAMRDAFVQLGEWHPEIAAEIYVVAGR